MHIKSTNISMLSVNNKGQLISQASSGNKLLLDSLNGLFSRTTWVRRYQKGKNGLNLNEAKDNGVLGCSGINCTIWKQYAPRSRQITTPTPHHSIFTGLPDAQPTVSKH